MRLTVLHAIPSLVGGGAERQLSLLAPQLCQLGLNIHVAYVHGGVNLAPLMNSPVHLHQLSCSGNHDPRILLQLLRLIRLHRPAIVQTWLPQMDILAGLAALITGTPFVISERSSRMAYLGGWKNALRKMIGGWATTIVANSQGGVEYWADRSTDCRIIDNGLSLELIRAAMPANSAELAVPTDARVVLFAGRLSPEKNVSTLLQALEITLDRHQDCFAVLFGNGPLRSDLELQVQGMRNRARVRLGDFNPDLWRWMRRASAFVSVSRFEGNPNAVLEAMAIGCPLVVSDIPQHREVLSASTALFCNETSASDVACAIDAVLDAPILAATRASAARCVADGYSVERAAGLYVDLYRELLLPIVASNGGNGS